MRMLLETDYRIKTEQNPEDIKEMSKEIGQMLQKYNHLGFITLIRTLEAAVFTAIENITNTKILIQGVNGIDVGQEKAAEKVLNLLGSEVFAADEIQKILLRLVNMVSVRSKNRCPYLNNNDFCVVTKVGAGCRLEFCATEKYFICGDYQNAEKWVAKQ